MIYLYLFLHDCLKKNYVRKYLWSTGHRNISKYKLQNDWSLGLLINGVPINRLIFKETKNTYFTFMGHDNCLWNINANVTMFLLASKLFVPTWYGRLVVVFMSKTKIKPTVYRLFIKRYIFFYLLWKQCWISRENRFYLKLAKYFVRSFLMRK